MLSMSSTRLEPPELGADAGRVRVLQAVEDFQRPPPGADAAVAVTGGGVGVAEVIENTGQVVAGA